MGVQTFQLKGRILSRPYSLWGIATAPAAGGTWKQTGLMSLKYEE
jgi:hypothetical protein